MAEEKLTPSEAVKDAEPMTRAERKILDDQQTDEEYRIREYLAISHQDGKCFLYSDDGELQCSNIIRHGRTVDFRREPIRDLLDVIKITRMKEYAESPPAPVQDADLRRQLEEARSIAECVSIRSQINFAKLTAVAIEKARLKEALRVAEWSVDDDDICPVCGSNRAAGHMETCEIGSALAAPDDGVVAKMREVLDDVRRNLHNCCERVAMIDGGGLIAVRAGRCALARLDKLLRELGVTP